ncbi:hypothetical protein GE061_001059 [Apolygus lucorum]|uniref:Peptidase C1A papain C-terminal domain-containing protein n=1 Tax=Apolygus lucorum TaxID=248454 RepID=A0A8S9Y5Z6_APOLU|nr:hypothetical protein GE061_001059 [Apolygus lucorum]
MYGIISRLFVICSVLALATANGCVESSLPPWPNAYVIKGALNIPYSEITEPFQAWFDGTKGSEKLRLDYFGGQTKVFEFSNWKNGTGRIYQVVPETTETFKNKMVCEVLDTQVIVGAVLPDPTQHKCAGKGAFNGIAAEKWIVKVTSEPSSLESVMWIRWKKDAKTGEKIPVPVAYESVGYDADLGTHYNHEVVSIYNYNVVSPPKAVWTIPQVCGEASAVDDLSMIHPVREIVHHHDHHINLAWSKFLTTHGRAYDSSEHATRKNIFRQNHKLVHAHNRANLGYTLALNHLADRTDEELKSMRGRKPTHEYNGGSAFPYSEDELKAAPLPINFDWRIHGAVNPVKNQASCGSCWSFGTTGTLEGAYFLKTGKLISLSEQALMDCSWGFGNNGCNGGNDFTSYQWIMKHGGIPLEEEYGPYESTDGFCHTETVKLVAPITGYINVTTHNERALKLAMFKHGPISIAINASLRTFSLYSNGVYYDPQCKGSEDDLDHAVLAVGYGWLNHKKYWLVKNSWSNYWGNDGYILMEIKNNNCGVMTSPTYVTM